MATISFTDAAPKFDGTANFVFGNEDFSLERDASYETEDAIILQGAVEHPWFAVKFPEVDVNVASNYDPTDPHDNPAADHLSPLASPETKRAAVEAEQVIMDVAYPVDTPDVAAQNDEPDEPVQVEAPSPVTDPNQQASQTSTEGASA